MRKFHDGDFLRIVSMDLDDSTWEEEVLDHSIDLSGFYLDLVVNRMQGLQFYQNRLVITPHLIAMGGMEHAGHDKDERDQIWDDVILLHEVESVQDMNTESELDDRGFHDAQGLIAIRTTADGRNRGVCVGVCVYTYTYAYATLTYVHNMAKLVLSSYARVELQESVAV